MENNIISEIWNGKIHGESEIENFQSLSPQLETPNNAKDVFLVNYNKMIWSWRLFCFFTDENNQTRFDCFNMLKEDIQDPNPHPR